MKTLTNVLLAVLLGSIAVTVEAADLPRTFGKLTYGMLKPEIRKETGAEFGYCASCGPGGDEISIGPKHFRWFASVFPGLVPATWMPQDAVVLLTTHGALSGIVLHPSNPPADVLAILQRQLKTPARV